MVERDLADGSIDPETVEALKKYNVNVDGLFAGEKLDQGTSRKVALEYLNIKKVQTFKVIRILLIPQKTLKL